MLTFADFFTIICTQTGPYDVIIIIYEFEKTIVPHIKTFQEAPGPCRSIRNNAAQEKSTKVLSVSLAIMTQLVTETRKFCNIPLSGTAKFLLATIMLLVY